MRLARRAGIVCWRTTGIGARWGLGRVERSEAETESPGQRRGVGDTKIRVAGNANFIQTRLRGVIRRACDPS